MFDFLKKKISDFTEKVKQAIEQKAAPLPTKEKDSVKEISTPGLEAIAVETPIEPFQKEKEKPSKEKVKAAQNASEPKGFEAEVFEETIPQEFETVPDSVKELKEKYESKRELKSKKSLGTKLKGLVLGETQLSEGDVDGFLYEFELALLESDVEQGTASAIVGTLSKQLVREKIKRGQNLDALLKEKVKAALEEVMSVQEFDFWKRVETKKPFIILFLGPNGAGKTTSVAKLCHLLQQRGKKVVLASSDTFRAGSIEQIEVHAEKLHARVVKHQYGADPAAVAFDAVKAAEAEHADVVLIDTAGRQETNTNLMQELKKIDRVVKPDLKVYIGESYTGQALLNQAQEFDKELGIDGFILTKMDTDAKGGTCISLLYNLKKPILFIGTGQGYEDLEAFDAEKIVERIVA